MDKTDKTFRFLEIVDTKLTNSITTDDFYKICRICLLEKPNLNSICDTDIVQKMKAFTDLNIHKDDGLPDMICVDCINKIRMLYSFKVMCEKNDMFLNELLKKSRQDPLAINDEEKNETQVTPIHNEHVLPKITKVPKIVTNTAKLLCVKNIKQVAPINNKHVLPKITKVPKIVTNTAKLLCVKNIKQVAPINNEHVLPKITKVPKIVTKTGNMLSVKNIKDLLKVSSNTKIQTIIVPNTITVADTIKENKTISVKKTDVKKSQFKCNVCSETFLNNTDLISHSGQHRIKPAVHQSVFILPKPDTSARTTNVTPTYECKICNRQCLSMEFLEQHTESHTKRKRRKIPQPKNLGNIKIVSDLQCSRCGKLYYDKATLTKHQKFVKCTEPRRRRRYICEFCGAEFTTVRNINKHAAFHKQDDDYKDHPEDYELCDTCGKHINKLIMETHIKICNRQCLSMEFLEQHTESHTNKRKRRKIPQPKNLGNIKIVSDLQCSRCGKLYYDKATLTKHQKFVKCTEPRRRRRYICEFCGAEFTTVRNINKHAAFHKQDDDYKDHPEDYELCDTCGKHINKLIMETHIKSHTVIKPPPATKCKRTKQEKSIFQCKQCPKRYLGEHSLTAHVRTKHENNPIPPKLICSMCGKGCYSNRELERHTISRHSDEKKYECPKCPNKYKLQAHVIQHLRRFHEKNKPYKCVICSLSFCVRSALKKHLKIHNREKNLKKFSEEQKSVLSKALLMIDYVK